MTAQESGPVTAAPNPQVLGRRLRAARRESGIGLRELSRRIDVSASFLSQVEHGRATPSVGTLYAIVNQLSISLDVLFTDAHIEAPPTNAVPAAPTRQRRSPVVRAGERENVNLASQVRWERLTTSDEPDVDFLYAVYQVGGASCSADALMRHAGHEYGLVLEGRLGLTIAFESWVLEPGDSVSFPSTTPHRLWAEGDCDAKVVWFVHGRRGTSSAAKV